MIRRGYPNPMTNEYKTWIGKGKTDMKMKKKVITPKFQTGLTEVPPFYGFGRSHITLCINQNGKKYGRVEIYDGSIKWIPAKSKTTYYTKTWEQFKKFMEGEK